MYFPIGWPKVIDTTHFGDSAFKQICCDRVKILFAILSNNALAIWYAKPCVPIVHVQREQKCIDNHGENVLVEWKPDSGMLVVATAHGTLLFYNVSIVDTSKGIYNQNDSPFQNLRRDSAELFIKEIIPSLTINLHLVVPLYIPITSISCINMTQLMIATKSEKILRLNWMGKEERDYTLDLKRIPFSINQQVSYAMPIQEANTYVTTMDYSPLVGGFSITLNDGRAAFLTAGNLKFDPNQVQGIWAQDIDDATCTSINHKFRLIAFGRKNSQAVVYTIDEITGALELSHKISLSVKDFPGTPGYVRELKWTPDGCAIVMSWNCGGISLWSTFGTMLMCSLSWDYGIHVDLTKYNPLDVLSMDWFTEGYHLLMLRKEKNREIVSNDDPNLNDSVSLSEQPTVDNDTVVPPHHNLMRSRSQGSEKNFNEESSDPLKLSLVQLDFVKSVLTVNPCMSNSSHLFLQGDDKIFISSGDSLLSSYSKKSKMDEFLEFASSGFSNFANSATSGNSIDNYDGDDTGKLINTTNALSESKNWIVIQLPIAYSATNWPIRFSAMDATGQNVAIAGRTGFAIYSLNSRRWKLFGNETQEKDFIVTGGLLWWQGFVIMGCYTLEQKGEELRIYPKETRLDNRFMNAIPLDASVMLINSFQDNLIIFTADNLVTIYSITRIDSLNVALSKQHVYDIKSLCVHSACIVSITLANLRNEGLSRGQITSVPGSETLVLNVSGRILMLQKETIGNNIEQLTPTCLASCVECLWLSESKKAHLKESLWLYCGRHGMRVWLPVFPREGATGNRTLRHTFMSRRIMLSFSLKVYPLAILFEDTIILGVENDTTLFTSDMKLHFSLPFCVLEKTSQVYLHQILRQLIRRNLGYNAWEIARGCMRLPYFPHSLELLLHEVLEEEATSKEPIPDALLPSILEFIQEFPTYLQTVVQCARKTEIALWPYLFSMAGKPKELFQQCLANKQLEIASSYLIILQNLEPSSVSRQYATLLLETALYEKKWDLAKDLVRFLRAIDPNDVESPRTSFVMGNKLGLGQQTTPVNPNAEDLSLIIGTVTRGRSFSTTVTPKQFEGGNNSISQPGNAKKEKSLTSEQSSSTTRRKISAPHTQQEKNSATAEEFFIEVILQRHARHLLMEFKLMELGCMSAALDFHLVGWLTREKDRAARIEDFVTALKQLHDNLNWPKPNFAVTMNRMEKDKSQQSSPNYSINSIRNESNLEPCDSGYTSLPANSNMGMLQTMNTAMNENAINGNAPYYFNEELSLLALSNMTSQLGLDNEIKVDEKNGRKMSTKSLDILSHPSTVQQKSMSQVNYGANETSSRVGDMETQVYPSFDSQSCISEQVSLWGEDPVTPMVEGLEQAYNNAVKKSDYDHINKIYQKYGLKLRYLLQIFTEASCLDFSLIISILLLDAASISRITNTAIRTESLPTCRQLRNGLKDITRWSFQECMGYRPFMMALQVQVNQLDRFVLQKEAIPNILPFQANKLGSLDESAELHNVQKQNIQVPTGVIKAVGNVPQQITPTGNNFMNNNDVVDSGVNTTSNTLDISRNTSYTTDERILNNNSIPMDKTSTTGCILM